MSSAHSMPPNARSNRPTAAVLPTRPPPPAQTLPSKPSTLAARSCVQCHRTLPINSPLVWCQLCCQKQVEHLKLLAKWGPRRLAQMHGSSAYMPIKAATPVKHFPNQYADADVVMVDATGGPSTSASPSRSDFRSATKRKADVMDSEALTAEGRPRGEDAALPRALPTEFQTGKALLDELSRDVETSRASRSTSSRPQYVNFHGAYTIVMDPDVRGERRVKRVVDELRQSAKLRFGTLAKRERRKSCGGHARTFWCACDPPPQPPKVPTSAVIPDPSASAPPNRKQNTLAKSESKEKLNDEALPLPPPGCGGTITVYAVTDFSHHLGSMGVEGQKVVVDVKHPGRDFKHVPQWYF